jgi:hypothetical protein
MIYFVSEGRPFCKDFDELYNKWQFFRVLAPSRLVDRCKRLGKTYCLHFQGTKPQEKNIILIAVKTSDFAM